MKIWHDWAGHSQVIPKEGCALASHRINGMQGEEPDCTCAPTVPVPEADPWAGIAGESFLDRGRPAQSASLVIHPEQAVGLEELLSFIVQMKAAPYVDIILTRCKITEVGQIEQDWNGDTFTMTVEVGGMTYQGHVEPTATPKPNTKEQNIQRRKDWDDRVDAAKGDV